MKCIFEALLSSHAVWFNGSLAAVIQMMETHGVINKMTFLSQKFRVTFHAKMKTWCVLYCTWLPHGDYTTTGNVMLRTCTHEIKIIHQCIPWLMFSIFIQNTGLMYHVHFSSINMIYKVFYVLVPNWWQVMISTNYNLWFQCHVVSLLYLNENTACTTNAGAMGHEKV